MSTLHERIEDEAGHLESNARCDSATVFSARDCDVLAALLREAAAELSRMRTALDGALFRMDRARYILTDGNPRPECNWGMLDTSDIRAAIAERALTAGSGNE